MLSPAARGHSRQPAWWGQGFRLGGALLEAPWACLCNLLASQVTQNFQHLQGCPGGLTSEDFLVLAPYKCGVEARPCPVREELEQLLWIGRVAPLHPSNVQNQL